MNWIRKNFLNLKDLGGQQKWYHRVDWVVDFIEVKLLLEFFG